MVLAVPATVVNLLKIPAIILTCLIFWPVLAVAHLIPPLGQIYYYVMFAAADAVYLRRQDRDKKDQLFKPLRDEYDERREVKALEIGPGPGTNFAYLPPGIKLTTLEVNPYLKKHFAVIQEKHPQVKIEQMIIGNAENMDMIADETFDIVIGTHLFCCIRDYKTAAKEIFRVLKPVRYL